MHLYVPMVEWANCKGIFRHHALPIMVEIVACARRTLKRHEPSPEDVRKTLRPMLKSWLDENLPRVVERMVEAEIERVTRGR